MENLVNKYSKEIEVVKVYSSSYNQQLYYQKLYYMPAFYYQDLVPYFNPSYYPYNYPSSYYPYKAYIIITYSYYSPAN